MGCKGRDSVEASRTLGDHDFRAMFFEILLITLAPIVVNGSIKVARAIVVEAVEVG